ncbi:MAG TPA: hypothetical protein VI258_12080 [Rhodanobacteraceae bacterium]
MTILVRLSLFASAILASSACIGDELPAGAPQSIKIVSADVVEEGEKGDRQATFTLVQTEQGKCYAVAPPGGEGIVAGESYVVIASSDVDGALRERLATDHPGCAIVEVVARAMKP